MRSCKALSEGLEGFLTSSQRLARQTQRSARQSFQLRIGVSYPKPQKDELGRKQKRNSFVNNFVSSFVSGGVSYPVSKDELFSLTPSIKIVLVLS